MSSGVFAPDLLDGRIVPVSGGGSGLGRAIAQDMTAVGALVVICGRRDAPLRETLALCPPGRCRAEACDVREEDQVEALVDATLARQGRIDVPVNDAGGQHLAWLATHLASEAGNYFSGSVLTLDRTRDVWRGSFPTRDYIDASGSIVAEARPNGRSEGPART